MRDVIDDMDNLFRRAAENYPLDTGNPDWNKVHSALQSDAPVEDAGKKNKNRRFLLLLLLIPATLFFVFIYIAKNHNAPVMRNSSKNENFKPVPPQNKLHEQNNTGQQYAGSKKADNENKVNPLLLNKNHSSSLKNTLVRKTDESNTANNPRNAFAHKYLIKGRTTATSISANTGAVAADNHTEEKIEYSAATGNGTVGTKAAEIATGDINRDSLSKQPNQPGNNTPPKVGNTKNTNTKAGRQNVAKKGKGFHLYAGIIAGPDISTIKLQKVMAPGFTAGILAGYRLTKKLSIESGLTFTKKYYYTEGKYFSTVKINLPAWLKIDNVDGYCNMLEFPVDIKYDLRSKEKVNWFVVAGVSSFFMQKESYGYRYKSYGQETEKNISFKESSSIWASVLNVSAGYSRNIGRSGIFRIEPYIKIPFKGVGVGSLPITSAGVYLAVIKKLF